MATQSSSRSIEDAVQEYIKAAQKPFTLVHAITDISRRLNAPLPNDLNAVAQVLMDSDLAFFDIESESYVPKHIFFPGAEFLLVPQPEEISGNILIPGHRFIPFVSDDVFPPACQLLDDTNTPIPTRVIRKPINDLLIFLAFFGEHGVLDYLVCDHAENLELMKPDRDPNAIPTFAITAFDMTDWYARHNVKPDDALRCTVKDWARGIYTLAHMPAISKTSKRARNRWIADLEDAILHVSDLGLYTADASAQLSEALFAGPESLRKNPPLHFGGFLAQSKKVNLAPAESGATLLSHVDAPPNLDVMQRAAINDRKPRSGRCDSLEAILDDLGLSTTPNEIEAIMRDICSRGTGDIEAVMDTVLEGRDNLDFYDENQFNRFGDLLDELWIQVNDTFDSEIDKHVAPLRSRILELLQRHIRFMRDADRKGIMPDQLPYDACVEIGTLSGMFSEILGPLNRADAFEAPEITKLAESFDTLEARFNELLQELEAACPASSSHLRILPDNPPKNDRIYQIKVSLNRIRPPIWRRLLVPASTDLPTLHNIIQNAMGWQNYHLHEFTINGINFGPQEDEDIFALDAPEPESNMRLSHFATKGTRFKYCYDFGDSWDHTIQVEKILPPDPAVSYPCCIKAKRACPPEDCGGPWGYQDLLETLNAPHHPDHTLFKEWVPEDFDPNHTNLSSINTRLQS